MIIEARDAGLENLAEVVPAGDLQGQLDQALDLASNVEQFRGWRVAALDERTGEPAEADRRPLIWLERGDEKRPLIARIVVGADGSDSTVAKLAGIERQRDAYQQTALVATIAGSGIEPSRAIERFTDDGPVALLPRGNDRHVVVMTEAETSDIAPLIEDDEAFIARLRDRVGCSLGRVSDVKKRRPWPLQRVVTPNVSKGRVVLIGNAATTVHPNGAQGLNLALRDVAHLIECLGAGPLTVTANVERPPAERLDASLLMAFASARVKDQQTVARATHRLAQLSRQRNSLTTLAQATLAFTAALPAGLKAPMIRRATGLFPSAPALALGHGFSLSARGDSIINERRVGRRRSRLVMSAPIETLVVGAGTVGLTTAILLHRLGHSVTVVDRREAPRTPQTLHADTDSARVFALAPPAIRVLRDLTVIDDTGDEALGIIESMFVYERASAAELTLRARDVGLAVLANTVDEAYLETRLLTIARECGVRFEWEQSFTTLHRDENARARVVFSGFAREADLVIAADGARSPIRETLGLDAVGQAYDHTAITASLTLSTTRPFCAYQHFNNGEVIALLPLAKRGGVDRERASLVWSATPQHADTLIELNEADFVKALNDAVDNRDVCIESAGARRMFPLQWHLGERYVEYPVAIIGDAAHSIHPLAGQGVNLGIMDAASLSHLLRGKQTRSELKQALGRYQRWRKSEAWAMKSATDSLYRLFNFGPARRIRGLGFNAVDRITPLKRAIVAHATGQAGDFPNGVFKS